LALRWWDIDLDGRVMMIQRSLNEGPSGPVLAPTKTRRSNRIALDAETVELLREELKVCARSSTGKDPARYVFSPDNEGERPWFPNWVTKRFLHHRKAAGLPHFRLHDLRHFMATQMLDAGVPIAVVAGRLGHARASTTLNVYAHAVSGADNDAAELLCGRLRQASLLGTSST
jgi:integrase